LTPATTGHFSEAAVEICAATSMGAMGHNIIEIIERPPARSMPDAADLRTLEKVAGINEKLCRRSPVRLEVYPGGAELSAAARVLFW
jgi:hypothetical protein